MVHETRNFDHVPQIRSNFTSPANSNYNTPQKNDVKAKDFSWSTGKVQARFQDALRAHTDARQRFKIQKTEEKRQNAKSLTYSRPPNSNHTDLLRYNLLKNNDKTLIKAAGLLKRNQARKQNNGLIKELTIENVSYDEEGRSPRYGNAREIMKHI